MRINRTFGAAVVAVALLSAASAVWLARRPGDERVVVPTVVDATEAGPAGARRRPRTDPARGSDDVCEVEVSVQVLPEGAECSWQVEFIDHTAAKRATREGRGDAVLLFSAARGGPCTVLARAEGFIGESAQRRQLSGAREKVGLTLRGLATVSGVVRDGDGPVEGVALGLMMASTEWRKLADALPLDATSTAMRMTHTDGEGRFEFVGVPPAERYVLEARHFTHMPLVRKDLAVAPGTRLNLDLELHRGAHLTGIIADETGRPIPNAPVHVLVVRSHEGTTVLSETGQVSTDAGGRFTTPALEPTSVAQIQSVTRRVGLNLLVTRRAEAPAHGGKDLGLLRPSPGRVEFRLLGAAPEVRRSLTVAAAADRDPVAGTVVLADVAFSEQSPGSHVATVVGLPAGRVSWILLDSDNAAVERGQFECDGASHTVDIDLGRRLQEPADPRPGDLTVRALGSASAELHVLVTRDGMVVRGDPAAGQQGEREVRAALPPGFYRVYVIEGGRWGLADAEVTEGVSSMVNVGATAESTTLKLTVTRAGEPVPHARIALQGFRSGSGGVTVDWCVADDLGRAEMRGIPSDAEGVKIRVMGGDLGRGYFVPTEQFAGRTVDLEHP